MGLNTDINLQFLATEPVKMVQQNVWNQKLTNCINFWGQKQYFLGEWNYIGFSPLHFQYSCTSNMA